MRHPVYGEGNSEWQTLQAVGYFKNENGKISNAVRKSYNSLGG